MRVLLFDLYGLFMRIQTPADVAHIHAAAELANFGVKATDFDRIYHELRGPLDAGTWSFAQYLTQIGNRLGADIGGDPRRIAAVEEADYYSWSHHDPAMVTWLEELRANGVVPGLLSNIPTNILAKNRARFPWLKLFKPAIFSCEVGLAKPDPAIYRLAATQMNAPPHDILFLDDTAVNIPPAHAVGMTAVLFTDEATARTDVHAFLNGEPIGQLQ
ncbi:MAG: HAD family phosphatase [Actinomycetaceae bacterium]|nr:HAD family phosphatase [Actinomycetaceae bacterium]